MTVLTLRRALAPLAAIMLLAGCGLQQVQPATKPGGPAVSTPGPSPTPAPVPTLQVSGGSVAATVNGSPISMSLFRTILRFNQLLASQQGVPTPSSQLTSVTMQQLVQDALIQQYAAAHGITVSTAAVRKQVASYIAQFHGQKAAKSRLQQLGLTLSDLNYFALSSLRKQKVEAVVAPLTTSGPAVRARQILISPGATSTSSKPLTDSQAHALAVSLLHRLLHGAQFGPLAKKYSADTTSASNGGIMGTAGVAYPGTYGAVIDQVLFHGPLKAPRLVHSQYGYSIIEVLKRFTARYPASVQQQAQAAAFDTWLTAQKSHATIHQFARVK